MAELRLLVAEDDTEFRDTVVRYFRHKGYAAEGAADGNEALRLGSERQFTVGVFDLRMPGMSGLELLQRFREQSPEVEILMLTGEGTIAAAVEAMKQGAYDFLTKPFPLAELERRCLKAQEAGRLRQEAGQWRALADRVLPQHDLLGESPPMAEVRRLISRAGPTPHTVLVYGESGAGKELVARALQRVSPRADKPFVVINCAAVPDSLLESEFFGHEKGAFTGAVAAKPGLFEVADGGTLFIDEIGELALPLQAKLLRVLEDGSLRRVGSLKERRVDVRIVAATNRRLLNEVQAGRFREDLYYRLNVLTIEIPPLRDRSGDVRILVAHFLKADWEIEPAALAALERYRWPGNVRQLINTLDRGKILADDKVIRMRDLPREVIEEAPRATAVPASVAAASVAAAALGSATGAATMPPTGTAPSADAQGRFAASEPAIPANAAADNLPGAVIAPQEATAARIARLLAGDAQDLEAIEKAYVLQILEREKGNKARAARALGIHRRKLYRLLDQWFPAAASQAEQTATTPIGPADANSVGRDQAPEPDGEAE